MKNYAFLCELRDYMLENPENINVGLWVYRSPVCGTVACAAGITVLLRGYDLEWYEDGSGLRAERCRLNDGVSELICDVAQDLLGLSNCEASYLFYASSCEEAVGRIQEFLSEETSHASAE